MEYLLGVDIGTSNIKAAIFDTEGTPAAVCSLPTPTRSQGHGGVYMPDEIWKCVSQVIRDALSELDDSASIAALAVASIGESIIPIDANGKAMEPVLCWFDERTSPLAEELPQSISPQQVFQTTGLHVQHICSAFKALWIKQNLPQVYDKVRHWLSMADYIGQRLTGELYANASLACRTMLFDLRNHKWSDDLTAAMELDATRWPEIINPGHLVGKVTASASKDTHLPAGMPVVAGGHDHICGAFAAGAVNPGCAMDSMGSVEAVMAPTEKPLLTDEAMKNGFDIGCHVAANRYYAITGILEAGLLMKWLRQIFWGPIENEDEAYKQLQLEAARRDVGANGLVFVRDFNRDTRSILLGMGQSHGRGDIARAVIETLCFEFSNVLKNLEGLTGQRLTEIKVGGGCAQNTLWQQIKADITGRKLTCPRLVEAGCLGAAVLAGIGTGIYADESAAMSKIKHTYEKITPDPDESRKYKQLVKTRAEQLRQVSFDA